MVDLLKRTCTCKKWELTGIPCYHAAACISIRNELGMRSTKNDIPKDATKLNKVGTIMNCTYCKAQGHNARTCDAKVINIYALVIVILCLTN